MAYSPANTQSETLPGIVIAFGSCCAVMNLARTQKALLALQRYEHRHLRVRRPANKADVREMVEEGLLEASFSDGSPESAAVVPAPTEAGRRFLQIFPASYRLCEAATRQCPTALVAPHLECRS